MFWKLRSFKLMSLATSSKFQVLSVSGVAGCPILISARPLQSYNYKSLGSFLVAGSDLCLSVAKFQVTRVPEVFWSQIPISACLFQSSKLPEFQKFFGCRYRSLPVCFKVTSYQSFRSFLVADTNLCLSVSKFQVTRVPEVFWSQVQEFQKLDSLR